MTAPAACAQCRAAVTCPGGHEPDGLCYAGYALYAATVHDAGQAMSTGDWARYNAAAAAYRAHVGSGARRP